jgi:hypothetical protein
MPDERANIRAMSIWNFGNAAVSDETSRTGSNAGALHGVRYPDGLPVLDFLATDSVATCAGIWGRPFSSSRVRPVRDCSWEA